MTHKLFRYVIPVTVDISALSAKEARALVCRLRTNLRGSRYVAIPGGVLRVSSVGKEIAATPPKKKRVLKPPK